MAIEESLRYCFDGRYFSDAGIGKQDIDLSVLVLDHAIEAIEVGQVGNVTLNRVAVTADLGNGLIECFLIASGDDDRCALLGIFLGRRQADATISTRDECNFIFQFLRHG